MITIRRAATEDLAAILALYHQLHPGEPPVESAELRRVFDSILRDDTQNLLVLTEDGRVAATLTLILMKNLTRGGKPAAYIENVVVDSGARGRGFGGQLIARAVELAAAAGAYKLFLLTGTINEEETAAVKDARHRFYRRQGFEDGIKQAYVRYLDQEIGK